eukprot:CAMPEP_0202391846 /NCGR_PEP_ID=MMETSP1127-20130417/92050_1 /ASSEMBLY_ACC=CAM_ASM_000462 /TAXON_ID=3047 /ORGANISM="Dunaliella tertiolecta, Strain CCMP1320" /LENGTH=111 /DNA_ID=CAMNT_0048994305 /DNA_START=1420 /DNA_END=1756 /DNA_ORIENTATION=-
MTSTFATAAAAMTVATGTGHNSGGSPKGKAENSPGPRHGLSGGTERAFVVGEPRMGGPGTLELHEHVSLPPSKPLNGGSFSPFCSAFSSARLMLPVFLSPSLAKEADAAPS